MQRIQRARAIEQPFDTAIPANPCETFAQWAEHDDSRIATAGAALRQKWCLQATAQTAPIAELEGVE